MKHHNHDIKFYKPRPDNIFSRELLPVVINLFNLFGIVNAGLKLAPLAICEKEIVLAQ